MNSDNGLLAKRIFQGDEEAFKILYEEFFHALLAIACKYVESEVAKDIVQDTFSNYGPRLISFLRPRIYVFICTVPYRINV